MTGVCPGWGPGMHSGGLGSWLKDDPFLDKAKPPPIPPANERIPVFVIGFDYGMNKVFQWTYWISKREHTMQRHLVLARRLVDRIKAQLGSEYEGKVYTFRVEIEKFQFDLCGDNYEIKEVKA